jgi:hypothetical protein
MYLSEVVGRKVEGDGTRDFKFIPFSVGFWLCKV